MLEILLAGVSTRKYREVLPEMAETVGVSKSSVSRESIEAGEKKLRELAERRFDELEILIIYLDGIELGGHHVIGAVGVDTEGRKHVLGLREGASENAAVVSALLEELVERGIKPDRRRLFVIDGSKALRKAIDQVYGAENPVQRCRNHKMRNVIKHLPKPKHDQVRSAMRAAYKLEADEGKRRLEQLASWLQVEHPSAAASLREGLEETFTINRLGLPASLRRCLGSTNLIDSTHSGVRGRMRRVTNWQSGEMAVRWAAVTFLDTERSYRRILGYHQLWILKAHLHERLEEEGIAARRKAV
jgi:transposase-like protein